MNYKPYPKYKDSGIEWLGDVPVEWSIDRADWKTTTERRTISNTEFSDQEVFHYSIPSVQDIGDGEYVMGDTIDSGKSIVAEAMLLVSRLNPRKSTIVKAFPKAVLTICSGEFVGLIPKSCDLCFLEYVYNSEQVRSLLNSRVRSVTRSHQRVEPDEIARLEWSWPPLPEQRAIAAFLDRETGRIDDLIAKKERQIELLQEKRQALISHAVTKGLNPQAKLKDSGIEWLGMIPEGWEVLPLRRVVRRFVDYRGRTPEKVESGVPLVTAANIKNGEIDFSASQDFLREEEYDEWMIRGLPKTGDVLLTTEAPLGEVALVSDERIALAQRIILLKINQSYMFSSFLRYVFLSTFGKSELNSYASGSTAQGIKAERLREIQIVVPPLEEQQTIVKVLDVELEKTALPVNKIRESIEKLREYRTALISAAVTGKIDVRGEV